MGCGIWGRVAPKWTYGTGMGQYGAQGLMGSYGMWDLGSGGPKMDIWVTGMDGDRWSPMGSGIWGRVAPKMELWGTGMDGFLWDLGFGVGWTNPKVDIWGQG